MSLDAVSWDDVNFGTLDHDAQIDLFRRAREALSSDPFRPLYHFSSPGAALHDAAGLCFWQGKFHLFYLLTTPHVLWARGHAISDDLVHWSDLPVAKDTIHGGTGQVWADEDRVIMGYATHKHAAVSLATSSDPTLVKWIEHPQNPVYEPGNDNYIWKQDAIYYMTLRKHKFDADTDYPGGRTTLELCRSEDLVKWENMGKLLEDGYFTEPGEDCACNSFLPIGNGKHLALFFSHKRSAQYYIGTFDVQKGRFRIETHERMNHGPVSRGSLHAPSAFIDPNGRCIGIWNIMENRPQEGWDQIMSLPRHLSLNKDMSDVNSPINRLGVEPVEELKDLRYAPVTHESMGIPGNGEKVLPGIVGKAMELEAVIDPMSAREVGLNVFRSPDGEEQTSITLFMHARRWGRGWGSGSAPVLRELMIDVSRASLDPAVCARSPETGPLILADGEPLRLRVFIDRSVVEVFANDRQCLTVRVYPTRDDSKGVSLFARGSDAKLVSLSAYQMKSVWPELENRDSF